MQPIDTAKEDNGPAGAVRLGYHLNQHVSKLLGVATECLCDPVKLSKQGEHRVAQEQDRIHVKTISTRGGRREGGRHLPDGEYGVKTPDSYDVLSKARWVLLHFP